MVSLFRYRAAFTAVELICDKLYAGRVPIQAFRWLEWGSSMDA